LGTELKKTIDGMWKGWKEKGRVEERKGKMVHLRKAEFGCVLWVWYLMTSEEERRGTKMTDLIQVIGDELTSEEEEEGEESTQKSGNNGDFLLWELLHKICTPFGPEVEEKMELIMRCSMRMLERQRVGFIPYLTENCCYNIIGYCVKNGGVEQLKDTKWMELMRRLIIRSGEGDARDNNMMWNLSFAFAMISERKRNAKLAHQGEAKETKLLKVMMNLFEWEGLEEMAIALNRHQNQHACTNSFCILLNMGLLRRERLRDEPEVLRCWMRLLWTIRESL
jgi:hypothetical protein